MRLSDVEIANTAIGLCGSSAFILSLDQDSEAAERCKRFLPIATEKVLRKHDWNCATQLIRLAQNTLAPTFEYDHAYALPYNCVRVVNCYENDDYYSSYDRWRVVGRNVHTDMDAVYLKYIAMPDDYRDLDVLLSDAVAYELAMMLAPTLMKDPQMFSILNQAKQRAYMEAQAIDTLENKFAYTENSVWNDARTEGIS